MGMRVGIIELLVESESRNWVESAYGAHFKRYYCSITPQVVAVWCRQLGHQTFYATFYGHQDPKSLLPDDLDVVFISTYTQASALAYALAKLYRAEKTLTVIGGPHAKSFPTDCLRFFDLVVKDCDQTLINDILRGSFDRHSIISSGRPLKEIPSVEERMPEIVKVLFTRGRARGLASVPLLSSVGCPYSCDFCVDWNSPYAVLPLERLEADLRYMSKKLPGVKVTYHDPNFGVKFDQVLGIIEKIPEKARNPYIMESSLSILRGSRLQRLKETNCIYVAPGIEAWTSYSNKAGVGAMAAKEKLKHVVEHFRVLREYVPGLQANFMFGSEVDHGDEPVELTKEFIRSLPYVWPTVNIPTPFGNTPLYDRALAKGSILKPMPFSFYYTPYLVTTMPNYPPVEYYDKLIDIYSAMTSARMLTRRLVTKSTIGFSLLHALRTFSLRQDLATFRRLQQELKTDRAFRSFHEGCSVSLPEFYQRCYEEKLGRYASLVSRTERIPDMEKPVINPPPAMSLAT
jgi:radical SAM superfamily enzyme YgiQ (UPF0313 family)